MNLDRLSRRRLLRHASLTVGAGALTAVTLPSDGAEAPPAPSSPPPGALDIRQFGAMGDGQRDDTAAFRAAFRAAAAARGNRIFLPPGNYRLEGTLDVPENVVLEGIFRAPTARTQEKGTTLLAFPGAGKPEGEPFITLRPNATLTGLTVFYPEQRQTNPPVAYPWTIRGIGDNCSLIDVLLVNPYQAVDFGTHPAGRHLIRGLYAQALHHGIFIDQCYDVGRVQDVHLWPFWGGWEGDLGRYTREHGTAFRIGRTDWEYLFNCFCIGYRVGFHFVRTPAGAPNAVLTQCGSDIGPTAVRVDACQDHAGVSFVNGQFMAGIEIQESNRGPVKFTACGFWNIPTTNSHAILEGQGHTTFSNCHFVGWAKTQPDAPAIHARRGGLTVNACDFADANKTQLVLEADIDAALVTGNRFRGAEKIINHAGPKALLAVNLTSAK